MRAMGVAVLAAVLAIAPHARADDSYVAPVIGPVVSYGGHAGAGTTDSILGGAGLYGGVRFPAGKSYLEIGAVTDFEFSHTFVGDWSLQAGLYLKHEFFTLWLNADMGLHLYWGLEPGIRYIPGIANSEFVLYGLVGLKVVGLTLGLAAGGEYTFAPGVQYPVGFVGETRLAFDLVEICHFFAALSNKKPLP
jgi:hypothetical protein